MATRKRVDSWVVTDDFWARVEPMIPLRERSVMLPLQFRTRSIRNVAPVVQVERGVTAQPAAA